MNDKALPDGFGDLKQFAGAWSLPTERPRSRKRLSSSMGGIQSSYDAILPRAEAIIEYLNGFDLDEMPTRERTPLNMQLALAGVANAVELFKEPGVIDGFDPERFMPMHE